MVGVDKRQVSSEFASRRIMIGKGLGAGLAAGFVGPRTMGKVNAVRRNAARVAQLEAVAPFNEAAEKVDALIAQLDGFKNEIDLKLLEASALTAELSPSHPGTRPATATRPGSGDHVP